MAGRKVKYTQQQLAVFSFMVKHRCGYAVAADAFRLSREAVKTWVRRLKERDILLVDIAKAYTGPIPRGPSDVPDTAAIELRKPEDVPEGESPVEHLFVRVGSQSKVDKDRGNRDNGGDNGGGNGPQAPGGDNGGNGGNPVGSYGSRYAVPSPTRVERQKMDVVLQIARIGGGKKEQARGAHVSETTLSRWLARGRSARDRLDQVRQVAPEADISSEEREWLSFLEEHEDAGLALMRASLGTVIAGIQPQKLPGVDRDGNPVLDKKTGQPVKVTVRPGDAQLALRVLKARYPDLFGEKHRVDVSGEVKHEHRYDFLEDLDMDALMRKRQELDMLKELAEAEAAGMIIEGNDPDGDGDG